MSAAATKRQPANAGNGRVRRIPSAAMLKMEERAKKAEAEARFWEGVAEAESHPLRMKILRALRDDFHRTSASSLSKLFQEPLGNIAYHAKVLKERGLLEVVDEIQRRGAMEKIIRVTRKARRG